MNVLKTAVYLMFMSLAVYKTGQMLDLFLTWGVNKILDAVSVQEPKDSKAQERAARLAMLRPNDKKGPDTK